MAAGDFLLFNEFSSRLGGNNHVFGTNVVKIGLVDSTITPAVGDATPVWADYSANEVTGTNYTAGGEIMTASGADWPNLTGAQSILRADITSWVQHAAGPSDVRWGIVYDDTNATDMAIGFYDWGGVVSLIVGNLSITWGSTTPNGNVLTVG